MNVRLFCVTRSHWCPEDKRLVVPVFGNFLIFMQYKCPMVAGSRITGGVAVAAPAKARSVCVFCQLGKQAFLTLMKLYVWKSLEIRYQFEHPFCIAHDYASKSFFIMVMIFMNVSISQKSFELKWSHAKKNASPENWINKGFLIFSYLTIPVKWTSIFEVQKA